jgi:hypothetical protein
MDTQRRWWHPFADQVGTPDPLRDVGSRSPEIAVVDLVLPSTHDSLPFQATVSVEARWAGITPVPAGLAGIARMGIAQRAEAVSLRHALTAIDRLRGELDVALLHWAEVADTKVHARAHCVSLDADEELTAAVAVHEAGMRRRTVLSWQGEQRARNTEHMSSLLLDPLRATASWFLDNQDNPEHVVTIARTFRELRDVLAPGERGDSPGMLVDDLLMAADEPLRQRAILLLGRLFADSGRTDLLDRLKATEENAAK